MHEYQAGNAISGTMESWLKNILPFTGIFILAFAPIICWGIFVSATAASGILTSDSPGLMLGAIPAIVITVLAYPLISAAIMHQVVAQRRGINVSLGESVSHTFRRFIPLMAVSFVSSIIIVVGFLFFFIPGVIFFCMFFVVTPVCVIEGTSFRNTLDRSMELTQGRRLAIFGTMILLVLVQFALQFVVGLVALVPLLGFIFAMFAHFGLLAVGPVAVAVVYDELCRDNETMAAHQLAANVPSASPQGF